MNILNEIEEFIVYCNDFYGIGGVYPLYKEPNKRKGIAHYRDVKKACLQYIEQIMYRKVEWQDWGGGDTIDRERVRVILEDEYGFREKLND